MMFQFPSYCNLWKLCLCVFRVLSSFLVHECMTQGRHLPRIDVPVYSLHLEGAVVCCTGFTVEQRVGANNCFLISTFISLLFSHTNHSQRQPKYSGTSGHVVSSYIYPVSHYSFQSELCDLIFAMGGIYQTVFSDKCTHLVAEKYSANNNKYMVSG